VLGVGLASGGADDDPGSTPTTTTAPVATAPVSTVPESTTPESATPESTIPPSTAPPSTALPSEAGAPASVAQDFEGAHRGIEHYAPGSGACVLDHELDSTLEVAGQSTWQYHAEYCGTVNGDLWSGNGTFVITAPDGATLVGTLASSARLPTDGEPYQLTITGGTLRFEGAAGSCALVNHLNVIGPGVQEQFGTFVCEVV
jgi:hypothetical protein